MVPAPPTRRPLGKWQFKFLGLGYLLMFDSQYSKQVSDKISN